MPLAYLLVPMLMEISAPVQRIELPKIGEWSKVLPAVREHTLTFKTKKRNAPERH